MLAEKMFRSKRCPEIEVQKARAELNELKSRKDIVAVTKQAQSISSTTKVVYEIPKSINLTPDNRAVMADLIREAVDIKKQMAELSNELHSADDSELKDLLEQISVLNIQKEGKWTEYRYIERNGVSMQDDKELEQVEVKSSELLVLEDMKRAEMQKRSKARKMLERLNISETKRAKYEEKVSLCNAEIAGLDEKIRNLK